MTISEKERRKAAAVSLVKASGKTTIPDALERGLGLELGLDASGLRYLFKELVKDGVLTSVATTKMVRTPPHVGRNGRRACKVIEFRLLEIAA
ncbi:TPA: hypothetical protein ACRTTK_003128 [Aeromonas hydrophila]